jgi:hypothetical protein
VLKKNLTQFQFLDYNLVIQSGGKGRDLKIWLSNFGFIKSKKNLLKVSVVEVPRNFYRN